MYAEKSLTATTLRFSWVIDNHVAASARPGRYGPIDEHINYLKQNGIRAIINLCEDALELPDDNGDSFEMLHVPILDGDIPTIEQMDRVFETVERSINSRRPCVIHCRGGIGRTTTILVPVLVRFKGLSMNDALELLRQSGRRTETMQQWRFLENWVAANGAGT